MSQHQNPHQPTERPRAYCGETITGTVVFPVRKQTILLDWETMTTGVANVVTLFIDDDRCSYYATLVLPAEWPITPYIVGSTWTFGIRCFVTDTNALIRDVREDFQPYATVDA